MSTLNLRQQIRSNVLHVGIVSSILFTLCFALGTWHIQGEVLSKRQDQNMLAFLRLLNEQMRDLQHVVLQPQRSEPVNRHPTGQSDSIDHAAKANQMAMDLDLINADSYLITSPAGELLSFSSKLSRHTTEALAAALSESGMQAKANAIGLMSYHGELYLYARHRLRAGDSARFEKEILILLKHVDKDMYRLFEEILGSQLRRSLSGASAQARVFPYSKEWATQVVNSKRDNLSLSRTFLLTEADENLPIGFTLTTRLDRSFFSKGLQWLLLLQGVIIAIGVLYLRRAEQSVMHPVSQLVEQVDGFEMKQDKFVPLQYQQENELSPVIRKLNHTFAALYDERNFSRILLGSIGDGILTTDNQGRVQFANASARGLVGNGEITLEGEKLEFLMSCQCRHSVPVPYWLDQIVSEGQEVEHLCRLRFATHVDEPAVVQICGYPLLDSKGDCQGAVIMMNRIS